MHPFSHIPPDFDPVQAALDWAHGLDLTNVGDVGELVMLETSPWAELHVHGDEREEDYRLRAGRILEDLANQEAGDPEKAAAYTQLLGAQAGLVAALRGLVHDPRFDQLPPQLRAGARAFAARALIRAVALELDPGGVTGEGDDVGSSP